MMKQKKTKAEEFAACAVLEAVLAGTGKALEQTGGTEFRAAGHTETKTAPSGEGAGKKSVK